MVWKWFSGPVRYPWWFASMIILITYAELFLVGTLIPDRLDSGARIQSIATRNLTIALVLMAILLVVRFALWRRDQIVASERR